MPWPALGRGQQQVGTQEESTMKKVIRDGKVAVIVSPDFGAGWSSWYSGGDDEFEDMMLFHPRLVELVEAGCNSEITEELMTELFGREEYAYLSTEDLTIEWLDVGTAFRVHEYDGSETIEVRDSMNWRTA
jgi:hypothetical protein